MNDRPSPTIYSESAYCNLEAWDSALWRFSIPSTEVELSDAEHRALIAACIAIAEGDLESEPSPEDQAAIAGLTRRLDVAIDKHFGPCFIKLGSRSAKDNWSAIKSGFAVRSGAEALQMLLGSMERIPDDLMQAKHSGLTPSIWVRQWMDFPRWGEFRCLVRDARCIGISQYNYQDGTPEPEILARAPELLKCLQDFLAEIIPHLPKPDLVVDIGFVRGIAPILIEVNPFNDLTDPCLFRDDSPMNASLAALFRHDVTQGPDFRYFGDGRDYPRLKKPDIDYNAMIA